MSTSTSHIVILHKEDSLLKLGFLKEDTGLTRAPDDWTRKSTCKTSAREDYNLPSLILHICK